METIEMIQGKATQHTNSIQLSWYDPTTGEEMWIQGEFEIKNGKIVHDVKDDNLNLLYTVEATL